MSKNDLTDPNGSNGSSPEENVEKFGVNFEGKEYSAQITEDGITVEADDIPESKHEALEKEVKAQLAAAKKKNFDLNREKEELDRKARELEERERRLQETPKPEPTTHNPIREAYGVETWDEVAQLAVDDPARHAEGVSNYAALSAQKRGAQAAYDAMLESQIRNEGFNPQEVKRFATLHGISNMASAYAFFKREQKPVSKGISLPDLQKASVKIAPSGKGGDSGQRKPTKPVNIRKTYDYD